MPDHIETLERKPQNGRKTSGQTPLTSSGFMFQTQSRPTGFGSPPTPNYDLFELMLENPTVQLGLAFATAPIRGASWNVIENKGAPAGAKAFIEDQLFPIKDWLLHHSMQALSYGWKGFEKVFELKNGKFTLKKLVPLNPKYTKVMIDQKTGAFAGLMADKGATRIAPEKTFVYSHDVQNNDYYGRSRLLNILQEWNVNEKLRERQGVAANRVTGMPIIRYPETGDDNTFDEHGSAITPFKAAKAILQKTEVGEGITMPSTLTPQALDAAARGADPSKLRAWGIEIIETSPGFGADFVTQRTHQENLILRGLLVPERALTSTDGGASKADSQTHADVGLSVSEWTLKEFIRHLNWYIVAQLMALNYGLSKVGTIEIQHEPIADSAKFLQMEILRNRYSPQNADLQTIELDIRKLNENFRIPQTDEPIEPKTPIIDISREIEAPNKETNADTELRENPAEGETGEPRTNV